MAGEASSVAARQAACFLRELLASTYRWRWNSADYIERSRQSEVHHRAVACVLAEHLWEHPRRDGDVDVSPDRLTPLVSKSLNGKELGRQNLRLFIDAFGISADDAARLWRIYEGSDKIRLMSGLTALSPSAAKVLRPTRHRTRSLHDRHYIGPDGLPVHLKVHQVIEATAYDKAYNLQLPFDTNCLTIEIEEGGRLVGPVYQLSTDVYAVDVSLDEPLLLGETASLTYSMSFHYSEAPEPELRRIVWNRVDSLGMRVEFHRDKLPSHVWWTQWADLEDKVGEREEVLPRAGRYAYRYVENVENAILGFTWDWC